VAAVLQFQKETYSGSPLLGAMPAHPLSSRVRHSDNKPISTLPRRWSAGEPNRLGIMFTFDGIVDIGVTRGVELVGSGEGGKILSAESGVAGKVGRE